MPLPMKTLREASVELGMPESEIRALVDMRKIRAVLKKGVPTFAPEEIAKIKLQRKTIPKPIKKKSTTADVDGQASVAIRPKTPAVKRPKPPPRASSNG